MLKTVVQTRLKSTHENIIHLNDEKEMKAFMRFKPGHDGKRMDLQLAATQPTELSIRTTNSFQKRHLTSEYAIPKCIDFNVYKQANVNIVIRSWQNYTG